MAKVSVSTWADRLRAAVSERQKGGESLTAIATEAGLTPAGLSRFMSGDRGAGLDFAEAIGGVLGLDLQTVRDDAPGRELRRLRQLEQRIAGHLGTLKRDQLTALKRWNATLDAMTAAPDADRRGRLLARLQELEAVLDRYDHEIDALMALTA